MRGEREVRIGASAETWAPGRRLVDRSESTRGPGAVAHLQGLAHGVHPHAIILDDHHHACGATDKPGGGRSALLATGVRAD